MASWRVNTVKAGNEVDRRLAHGDGQPGDSVPGMIGYTFDDGGDYDRTDDVLIAKLIDSFNGDGVPSAGDLVITDQHPTNLAGTAFANLGNTSATIDPFTGDSVRCSGLISGGYYNWLENYAGEHYVETFHFSQLQDGRVYHEGGDIRILVALDSPSSPTTAVFVRDGDPATFVGDHTFVDIDLNYTNN